MKKYNPKNLNVEKLYKNASHGIRTHAKLTVAWQKSCTFQLLYFFVLLNM